MICQFNIRDTERVAARQKNLVVKLAYFRGKAYICGVKQFTTFVLISKTYQSWLT